MKKTLLNEMATIVWLVTRAMYIYTHSSKNIFLASFYSLKIKK